MSNSDFCFDNAISEIRKQNDLNKIRVAFIPSDERDMLKSFNNDLGETLVSWSQLREAKIGERNVVNEKVSFEKASEDENHQRFLTYMEEGGTFGTQEHDCYEVCKVIKGNLIERERGYKMIEEGHSICYSPFEKHKPYATRQSIYEVIFYKTL